MARCAPDPAAVKDLGKRLRRFGRAQRALLPDVHAAESWTLGGCGVFAVTLKEWLGRHGKMVALVRRRDHGGSPKDLVLDHLAVKVGPYYLDGDGAHTEHQLIASSLRWYREDDGRRDLDVGDFWLRPARRDDWSSHGGIPCPYYPRITLSSRLVDAFGEDPRPYICPERSTP